ncbi:MAG: S1 RNA-binding domain-containing protein [Elusimicrobiota bacterium]
MEEEKNSQSLESGQEEDFAKLFEEQDQRLSGFENTQVLFGRLVSLQEGCYLIDIGLKFESRLPADLVPKELTLEPGMRVPVVRAGASGEGFGPNLSLRGGVRQLQWSKLDAYRRAEAVIDAQVFRPRVEGFFVGLFVEPEIPEDIARHLPTHFWQAFPYPAQMTLSEVDMGDPRPLRRWIGRKIQVKILELRSDGVAVVSRKKVALERREAQREESWNHHKIGGVVAARIKTIEPMGALLDIDGIEATLSQVEVSWYPNPDLTRHLRQGETIDVKILKKDEAKRRFLVSRRALLSHPADELQKSFKRGAVVEGVVSKILGNGGCFVRLAGFKREAFIPANEMVEDGAVKEGAPLKAIVIRIERESIRLVLSARKYEEKQMPEIMARYTKEIHTFNLGDILSSDDESSKSEES